MKDEIRQNGQVILSSDDGISIPMIYNNLVGVNMQGTEYRDYLKHVAMEDMGFEPGRIEYFETADFSSPVLSQPFYVTTINEYTI